MLRFLTAGESHGFAEIAILEGIPAGLSLSEKDIQAELLKRQGGAGRGGRGRIEKDNVKILSGILHGKTIGSPIALLIENLDFFSWKDRINSPVTNPRPGHADLAGILKFGLDNVRSVIERASARETVMRVAVGAICKKFLSEFEIGIASHTTQIGKVKLLVKKDNFELIKNVFLTDPDTHCIDKQTSLLMKKEIIQATAEKDTLGGIVEIIAHNVPTGLGSYIQWDKRLDGIIAQALMSIPSVKAVEIGDGINNASRFGSMVHDEIFYRNKVFFRKTNRSGGIEGGISNGEDIVCRIFLKPISTLGKPLRTVDIRTKKESRGLIERSDICVVPRAGVIAESMLAFVLSNVFLEKFGGDSVNEAKRNYEK